MSSRVWTVVPVFAWALSVASGHSPADEAAGAKTAFSDIRCARSVVRRCLWTAVATPPLCIGRSAASGRVTAHRRKSGGNAAALQNARVARGTTGGARAAQVEVGVESSSAAGEQDTRVVRWRPKAAPDRSASFAVLRWARTTPGATECVANQPGL